MERKIIETILKINNRCLSEREKKEILKNLSPREAQVMVTLNPDEKVGSSDLAQRNDLSPSRMSRIVDSLCKKNYLTRHSSEDDRRAIVISLSATGEEHRAILITHSLNCESDLRTRLSEKQFNTVQDALNILIKTME